MEVSVTRTSRKAALSANRLSEYSSSLLEYNVVYQESTVITCAKNRTCNLCSSNVQARVTSCVRQPATARKWRQVMQMPLGVYSWDPRNHVSQKRAHWRHLANMIAYITRPWCRCGIMQTAYWSNSTTPNIGWWGVGVVICLQRGADCIWSSLCHCHPKTPSSLAVFKSRLVLLFWYWLTQVVLEKRPLNQCGSSSTEQERGGG